VGGALLCSRTRTFRKDFLPLTIPISVRRGFVAFLLILAFVFQGTTSVLAGTTGAISGTVIDASTNQPVAGAHVTAASPSQTASTTTNASGRYTFVSLAPDTYSVSVAPMGDHDAYSVNGVTVQADQNLNVALQQPHKLQAIGRVASRAASALVKPGTTADVYSINATTQDKSSAFGGGSTLNSAWSALTSVPGVYVAPGSNGYIGAGPGVSIRGGDYSQIGYELDGIPVNRSFDNYPSSTLSSLGQQEVQVYTGAAPANSQGEAIAGYINQVIKTGTAPATRTIDLGVGSPTFYNKLSFEAGGANPSRTFSYYVGLGGYDQSFRPADQFNGASLSTLYGQPLAKCPAGSKIPSCTSPTGQDYTNGGTTPAYVLGPYDAFGQAQEKERDTVVNLHFGIPRKDGNHDDIQFMYDNSNLRNYAYDSTNDLGGAAYLNSIGFGTPTYLDGYQTTLPYGALLPPGYNTAGGVQPYLFPNSPSGRAMGAAIDPNARDQYVNDQAILKLQYQHNFGTNAFLRIYGYTDYSDWLNNGPQSTISNYVAYDSSDYQLASHAKGGSIEYSNQINAQNLLTFQGNYSTAASFRFNNSGIGMGLSTPFAYLVNGNNPYSGVCYTSSGGAVPGCNFGAGAANMQTASLGNALNGTFAYPAAGTTCGGGPCQYVVVGGGPSGSYNTVVPKFSSASFTDTITPNSRLNINLGLRFDRYEFDGSNTFNSNARTLFFNAYNLVNPNTPLANTSNQIVAFDEWQPRFGMTFTVNPTTVVRASYGRYAQAPTTAFEQYNFLQPNDISTLAQFNSLGLGNTPGHDVRPEVSNNLDASLEHSFGRDVSVKVSPFLRKTQDQIQQFYLNQKTAFVSGLNVGRQTSEGVELEVDKGDFARNGFAAKASFTYTHSFINYDTLANGTSIVGGINNQISAYNSLTKAGNANASPCYTLSTGGAPGAPATACGANTVANPYYNAPAQPLLDPNASYPTFDIFPGPIGVGYQTIGAPYVGTLLMQYKHDKLAITPALQFSGGQRYGAPATTPGYDPSTCTTLAVTSCAATLTIPDQFTNQFDGLGAFVAPSSLQLHLQASYDVSKRVTLVANFTNIINTCFGGTKVPFAVSGACNYTTLAGAGAGPVPAGNTYGPGAAIQPFLASPFYPTFSVNPVQMFFEARLKV
jgi:outer membrane receptor protein involved in Fe transport